jgi:lysophospholipase L1-like esterase
MSAVRRASSLVLLAVTVFTVATVLPGLPTRAAAATLSYAALGDSYSSGVGADDYDPDSGSCRRGSHAYPVLWAAAHSPASFAFVACGGATTDTVRASQLGVLTADTSLVTISVGGNDIGFANVMIACKLGSTSDCANAVAGSESQSRAVLPAKLATTYADIKAKAPNARLIVLGYPRLFETADDCGLFAMSLANRTRLNEGADVLEATVKAQAEAAGATYVTLNNKFEEHRVCASQPWINGTVIDVVNSYHPRAEGYSQAYLPALNAVTG